MDESKKFSYPGSKTSVHWDGNLCIHHGECGRATGELFVAGRQPWCQPDFASDEEVREVVLRCPTGALSATFEDGSEVDPGPGQNHAAISQNGPVYIKGQLDIEGHSENAGGTRNRVALCRCGHSKNKPFCDNSHEAAGFVDSGAVGPAGPGFEQEGGPLTIKPVPDGPVMVLGNLSIMASTGRLAWHGKKAALCRCGQSGNKPFCDGSHKDAGFKS